MARHSFVKVNDLLAVLHFHLLKFDSCSFTQVSPGIGGGGGGIFWHCEVDSIIRINCDFHSDN